MNHYDDDRVIALLRDAVPAVPDTQPDRIGAIRDRAGRQRTMVWTQTLGAVASVVLVVGMAAAVSAPTGNAVEPTNQPISVLADALLTQRSVRFEATMEPTGTPRIRGMSDAQVRRLLTAEVDGAATRDGDLQVDGDLSFMNAMLMGGPDAGAEHPTTRIRVVDGKAYRTLGPGDDAPPGKTWVLEDEAGSDPTGVEQLAQLLRRLPAAVDGVRYTGQGTVRGTRVAEYELTIPTRVTRMAPVTVEFALDDDNLLRRVSAEFSWSAIIGIESTEYSDSEQSGWTEYPPGDGGEDAPPPPPAFGGMPPLADPLDVRVQIDFFGYGDDVRIVAPPASEVTTWDEIHGNPAEEYHALQQCLEDASSHDEQQVCYDRLKSDGTTVPLQPGCVFRNGVTSCGASAQVVPPGSPPRPGPTAEASPSP